jgi:hypothetical protein
MGSAFGVFGGIGLSPLQDVSGSCSNSVAVIYQLSERKICNGGRSSKVV